jgi:peptide/nickel transport system substrate-binding protein
MNMRALWRGTAIAFFAIGVAYAQTEEPLAPQSGTEAALAEPAATAPTAIPAMIEPPFLEAVVAAGDLPPVGERIPSRPLVTSFEGTDKSYGEYGGTLDILGASTRDTRQLLLLGYARLVVYDENYGMVPDICESFEVEEGRRFTFHLRPGHRWSDGAPFTSDDFRYYWEDIATNPELSRFGPPKELLVDGELPVVEFPDEYTVRYTWSKPNPYFLPKMAAAQPIEIFKPSHYLRPFHARYAGLEAVEQLAEEEEEEDWADLHTAKARSNRNDNVELPTLHSWVLMTEPPSDRFIFKRNPYFHRIDARGHQLPYIDQVALSIASSGLIPAKVAAGEADLQGQFLAFSNYTFLKEAEDRSDFEVRRWLAAKGARVALFPNMTVTDPVWRELFRNADFRRALSVAINREDINNAIFYGLATPGNNTVLPDSPLFKEEFRTLWTQYDPDLANELLDRIGLTERDGYGTRLLPDGRPMQIVVETAGEEVEQTDVLELVRDDWSKIGVRLFAKPSQREVLYKRLAAGSTMMAVWSGLENGLPLPEMSPEELAPLNSEQQFQWPAWGAWAETSGQTGEEPELSEVRRLMELKRAWAATVDPAEQTAIWQEMLGIWAQQTFTIGIVQGVDQLVVVSNRLQNVPEHGIYNYDPGAYFGMYRPDTFFLGVTEETLTQAETPS